MFNGVSLPRWGDNASFAFSCCIMTPDSKQGKPGSCNQEISPPVGKNTEVVLVPCHKWKSVPTAISDDLVIAEVPESY